MTYAKKIQANTSSRLLRSSHSLAQERMPTRSNQRLAALAAVAALSTSRSQVSEAFTPPRKKTSRESPNVPVVTPERNVVRKLSFSLDDEEWSSSRSRRETDKKSTAKGKTKIPRTTSFGAITAKTWPKLTEEERNTPLHTLILGTHPSQTSFEQSEYYAFPINAFWWIAGDCLGFRRGSGISSSTGQPYKFSSDLREEYEDRILSYEDQVSCLVRHGFGLWDIVGSCQRRGSLDKDIQKAEVNMVREFAAANPHLRRIVIANGEGSAALFCKNFSDWCESGELRANDDNLSQRILGRKLRGCGESQITLVVAMSPSPAATKPYVEKRDFWEKQVYEPGLADHEALNEPQ